MPVPGCQTFYRITSHPADPDRECEGVSEAGIWEGSGVGVRWKGGREGSGIGMEERVWGHVVRL
jgi:hypothetical protein